jgi:hypothetical protein
MALLIREKRILPKFAPYPTGSTQERRERERRSASDRAPGSLGDKRAAPRGIVLSGTAATTTTTTRTEHVCEGRRGRRRNGRFNSSLSPRGLRLPLATMTGGTQVARHR